MHERETEHLIDRQVKKFMLRPVARCRRGCR
jgi:hypothetical protein